MPGDRSQHRRDGADRGERAEQEQDGERDGSRTARPDREDAKRRPPPDFTIKTDLLDPEVQFKKGVALLESGQCREAITQLQFASDCDPSNGVYRYGSTGFPQDSWNATNYWVDVVFTPGP